MILKGEKVVLRPIRMSDAPRFVKWFSDSKVNKFLLREGWALEKIRKWIRDIPKNRTIRNFAIDTEKNVHIGSITLYIRQSPKIRHTGYIIMLVGERSYWNKGYGTDALRTVLVFGFRKLRLHRIELDVIEYNPRAIKVYRRLGFKTEGQKREHIFYKRKFYDELCMGILKNEWLRRNKKKL